MGRNRNPLPIPPVECPLGEEHCALLNSALQSCHDTRCRLSKLAALGLDVSAWMSEVEANERLASGLKEIHFPDRP